MCVCLCDIADFPLRILDGHDGRVTCLLYPFNESTRYESHHLLSGGVDFSVILWDINSGCRIHTFTVHGGMLVQLIVPPANCNVSCQHFLFIFKTITFQGHAVQISWNHQDYYEHHHFKCYSNNSVLGSPYNVD